MSDDVVDHDDQVDIHDPEFVASQRAQLAQLESSRQRPQPQRDAELQLQATKVAYDLDDDALAQAIAEQDLPPGVSVAEQQEIMMRLLTQQLRRGDWANESELSPGLEQRLRDFQFAQRKRREKYGDERPWGILGLYDHLGE